MSARKHAAHCPQCEWTNIYMTSQDGSRELELYEHLRAAHTGGAA